MRSPKNGFTLVELIIVITIIGILASVITFSFRPFIEKAKFSNNQALIDDIVKTMNLIEVKEEKDIRELTKTEFINLYNKYHQRYLNNNRFYDLGLNENKELLIIVIYKDLYTVYNYETKKYTNTTDEAALTGLIVVPEDQIGELTFELLNQPIPVNLFIKVSDDINVNCYLYQDNEYQIYFYEDLINGFLALNKDLDLEDVKDIISDEIEMNLKSMDLPGSKTFLVYYYNGSSKTYSLYQEGVETPIASVSKLHLRLLIS